MENIKRPSLSETDDDLLREQERFLQERKKPSVKLVSSNNKTSFDKETSNSEDLSPKTCTSDLEVMPGDVIFDVQERNVSFSEPFVFQPSSIEPTEMKNLLERNVKLSKFASKKKAQSIFAQMLNSVEDQNEGKVKTVDTSKLIDGSGLTPYSKDSEVEKIHEENLSKLSSMSQEEIMYHQEQLKNYLKPEILSFIKKKKNSKKEEVSKRKISKNQSESSRNNLKDEDLPGEILRKEGNEDCDALILEKAMEFERTNEFSGQEQNPGGSLKIDAEKSFEIPLETKELIENSSKGLWKNMNKIEKEKLEWMTNLPQPKPLNLKTGYTARFDFEGKLVSREVDIPTYKGLHHHGDEPEVPGYSLEELFLLARSSLQSQRITALNTIAHILENNWCGMMDSCFEAPLLPMLLNAGIVPLLRWALDDTSLTSISATITAIHSLLISKADEACSKKTFCWLNGHLVPQLEPQDLDEPNIVIEELTDADLIRLDVIKGFLRIDIVPRFMYIVKVMCPPPLVCKLIIEICARLAQHSLESAKEVAHHPGLLSLLLQKFLPLNWHFVDSSILTDTVNYSCPMASALKLIRIIISASKELALDMVEKCGIVANITFYLTVQPIDGKLTAKEVQLLVIETLKTWHTLLCYGLAVEVFLDLFPVFLKQLEFCLSLNMNSDPLKHLQDFDYASHLFKSFEAVTVIAAEQRNNNELMSAVDAVFKQALVCLQKWIWQFSRETTSYHGMLLLSSCMNFIVTHCKKSHEGLTCENWKPCSAAKEVFETYLIPALKSDIFQDILKNWRPFSLFLKPELSGNRRDGKTIVSLGSVMYGEDIVTILKDETPLPLLSAVLNFALFYKNSFHDCGNDCVESIFSIPVVNYLKEVSAKEVKGSCWFLKFENYFIYQLIELSSFIASSDTSVYYDAANSVLLSLTTPEESLLADLFENIIFKVSAIPSLAIILETSNSDESTSLSSLSSRLPVIAQCYTSCFLSEDSIYKSRSLLSRKTDTCSLFCLSSPNVILSKDWCFMPIFYLYQREKQRKEKGNLTPEEMLQVMSCLQWIYLSHMLKLPFVKNVPASVEFYYLCLVFLIDDDMFRDEKIKTYLVNCVSIILKQKKLKLTKIKWSSLHSFDDLYLELLIQYEAVSYGDETFGNFLTLPLQQCYPSQWKKSLLTDFVTVLNILRVPFNKLFVPVQNFLHPTETDMDLLAAYLKVLSAGNLTHQRCPLVYVMAVHYIHNFLFLKSDSLVKNQKVLISRILKCRKDLIQKILLYSKVDEMSEFGFTMTEELSPENRNYLTSVLGASVNI